MFHTLVQVHAAAAAIGSEALGAAADEGAKSVGASATGSTRLK